MAKLIREQPKGLLGRREWWSLNKSCEAMIAYEDDICSIHVMRDNREDITKALAEKINAKTAFTVNVTATIDCYFIECAASEVTTLLAELEELC